jgi:predicted O-methyltransferase YrrM
MFFAEAVGGDGKVVTVEVGAEFADIARRNFDSNGFGDRIELLQGDAMALLPSLARKHDLFDFIFLDGDKAAYGELLGPLLKYLDPKGLMVVDDIFCLGDALNLEANTSRGVGVQKMLAAVAALKGYDRVILPYGNGQLFLRNRLGGG